MQMAKKHFKTFLKIAFGAGVVAGGAYAFSRLKEKQDTVTRLERMEQIVEELSKADEVRKGKKFEVPE